ncbi:type IV pilus modification PilV family protein [Pseudoduganella violaceinigra]|uniref:type IV pilus modification PilV family protein n=1 Tax=Pseudoduganella violaceinigra TaxID=246602 RepID=UPI000405661F|nr:hypothetical protein [Pseudoduganella violaceinigra]
MQKMQKRTLKNQGGIVMLEGLVAIVIFSFGVLAMVAMQAVTTRAAGDAKYRVDASFVATQTMGELWGDRLNLAAHAKTDEPIASLPGGKRTILVNGNQVTVTVSWQSPGESKAHTHSTTSTING